MNETIPGAAVNDQITDSVTQTQKKSRAKTQELPTPVGVVIFESREKEPTMFDVAGIRPTRNFSTGRLEWEVAGDDVERFEQNHFVQLCRVVRKAV
jgi:hypothetical protein